MHTQKPNTFAGGIQEDTGSGVVLGSFDCSRCHERKSRDCAWKRKRGDVPAWESECRRLPAELPTSAANLPNTRRESSQRMKAELQGESRFARNLIFGASTRLRFRNHFARLEQRNGGFAGCARRFCGQLFEVGFHESDRGLLDFSFR